MGIHTVREESLPCLMDEVDETLIFFAIHSSQHSLTFVFQSLDWSWLEEMVSDRP